MPHIDQSTGVVAFTAEDVLRVMYRAAFGRDPEPDGLGQAAILQADPDSVLEMALRFHNSDEHQIIMNNLPMIRDHSQHGEFPKLLKHVLRLGQKHGIIVDVGARAKERSNSWDLLSNFGWKGLLVEANPALIDSLRGEFAGLDFVLAPCAVGLEPGKLPFFVGHNADVSSLIEGQAAAWGEVKETIEVEVVCLETLLASNAIPYDFDVLSLDIEGLDIVVFNDLIETTYYRPGLVVLEASYNFATRSLDDVPLSESVKEQYTLIDQTPANLILGSKL